MTDSLRRFGDFELDLRTGALRRGDRPVPLQRQPALALVRLVAHPGEVVTREQLRHAIWSGDLHVDFERGLNFCIRQVRVALEDGAKVPRFVETVPRMGYRFIAPVTGVGDARADGPVAPAPLPPRSGSMPLVATLVVALAFWGGWLTTHPVGLTGGRHHARAVTLVRAAHDAVTGPGRTGSHHVVAAAALTALHDAIF